MKATCEPKSFHAVAPSRECESHNEAVQTQNRSSVYAENCGRAVFPVNEKADMGVKIPISACMLLVEET